MRVFLFTGGFYSSQLSANPSIKLVSLNTNLWYTNNKVVDGTGDPSDQFAWFEHELFTAERTNSKVLNF